MKTQALIALIHNVARPWCRHKIDPNAGSQNHNKLAVGGEHLVPWVPKVLSSNVPKIPIVVYHA